jgi:hypothetical protein
MYGRCTSVQYVQYLPQCFGSITGLDPDRGKQKSSPEKGIFVRTVGFEAFPRA